VLQRVVELKPGGASIVVNDQNKVRRRLPGRMTCTLNTDEACAACVLLLLLLLLLLLSLQEEYASLLLRHYLLDRIRPQVRGAGTTPHRTAPTNCLPGVAK
jgi:hypothetical protein